MFHALRALQQEGHRFDAPKEKIASQILSCFINLFTLALFMFLIILI